MKKIMLIVFLFKHCISIAQSKKDQIENYKMKIDSLNSVIISERNTSTQKIISLNSNISNLELTISNLKLDISNMKNQIVTLNFKLNLSSDSLSKIDKEYRNLNEKFGELNNRLTNLQNSMDSITKNLQKQETEKVKNDDVIIKSFVTKIYSSLELTPELNKKNYLEGGVKFKKDAFNSCIDVNSIFSDQRISNLTGEYHDRFNIKLINIDSIKFKTNTIEVLTLVEYEIYELGRFQNEEKLIINVNQGNFKINKWEDVKINTIDIIEELSEIELYKIIGSMNN